MKSLISIDDIDAAEATAILDETQGFAALMKRKVKKAPALRGRTVINMFFESSIRTRSSFEIAGKWLSADVINFSASGSSVSKGESVLETARTLQAMAPDCVVVRHQRSGVPLQLARELGLSIINAGDGTNEHPTQALLDAYSVRQRLGRLEGLTVAIVGDIVRSRVARSGTKLFRKLGAKVRWVGPQTLLPPPGVDADIVRYNRLPEGIADADVVMMLRIQHERGGSAAPFITNTDDYSRAWGLSPRKLEQYAPRAVVMHPGPANVGVEISRELIDHPASLISDQVSAGVAIRMALLYRCIEGAGAALPPEA